VQRVLARAGLGSRRSCEDLITAGSVKINGVVATLGDKVDPTLDLVEVDGHRVPLDPDLRYFALHKPAGVVTTLKDPQGRRDLTEFLPKDVRVFPVGRLDLESEGLLLLTNDGELANRLMHPKYGVEKEYLAEVEGRPTPRDASRLRMGVNLSDGPAKAMRASVVAGARGKGAIKVLMGEGRKREVRRMLAEIGLPVVRLVRLRVGPIRLREMPAGTVRELTPGEVRELYEAAGL
jgi:pseudouridine synthase